MHWKMKLGLVRWRHYRIYLQDVVQSGSGSMRLFLFQPLGKIVNAQEPRRGVNKCLIVQTF